MEGGRVNFMICYSKSEMDKLDMFIRAGREGRYRRCGLPTGKLENIGPCIYVFGLREEEQGLSQRLSHVYL